LDDIAGLADRFSQRHLDALASGDELLSLSTRDCVEERVA
jgi:hypothetical protein